MVNERIKALIKEGKTRSEIIKIIAAETDMSLYELQNALDDGFDTVEWIWDEFDYDICYDLDKQTWSLEDFIADLNYEAPIFEKSHVNCQCSIRVSNSKTGEIKIVNYTGIISDVPDTDIIPEVELEDEFTEGPEEKIEKVKKEVKDKTDYADISFDDEDEFIEDEAQPIEEEVKNEDEWIDNKEPIEEEKEEEKEEEEDEWIN